MFDDCSDEEVGFTINKGYAERYNKWRRAEELQKLKDRYGDVETDSSTSESEDEEGEALTSQVEKGWLKALAALKTKDPKIYQKDVKFYSSEESSEEEGTDKEEKEKKSKPVYLKDYERKLMLEKHGKESSDESDSGVEARISEMTPGYFEQQEEIRKSLATAVDSSDDSDSELLTHRKKTQEEEQHEEEEYMTWLKGQKKSLGKDCKMGIELGRLHEGHLKATGENAYKSPKEDVYAIDLKPLQEPLRDYWNDPALDEGEKFLKDFILNKRYMDKDTDRLPTYDEIVDDSEDISDDEEDIAQQEKFERKFNFRFEEPGAEEIKSFPRSIDDSVRRKDSKRVEKRHEKKEKKKQENAYKSPKEDVYSIDLKPLQEKVQRQEELKQLKKFKRQEIEQKIDQLREITGNKDIGFSSADLEGDFDPAEHDRLMQQCFADDYYEGEEQEKPVFGMDDDDLNPENWDSWQGEAREAGDDGTGEEPHADDPNFVMDADFDPSQDNRSGKKKKKKNRLAKALAKKKPVFNPEDKTFEEYVDEYYKLDYEDMIGDIPCRFKYRKVTPNDFGLEVGEILTCRDKELNSWVSVKKMSQYRTEEEELNDKNVYAKRAATKKKMNILSSLQDSDKTDLPSTSTSRSTKSQKKKRKNSQQNKLSETTHIKDGILSKKKKADVAQQNSDIEAEGRSPKKLKLETNTTETSVDIKTSETSQVSKKKRKKKSKRKSENVEAAGSCSKRTDPSDSKESASKPQHSTDSSESNVSHSVGKKTGDLPHKPKKNKKKGIQKFGMSDERLKAYGINPKKIRFMKTDNFKKQKSK